MQAIVDFLHGKKAILLAIAGAILLFLTSEHVIGSNLAILIQSILTILGAGADVATQKLGVSQSVNLGK